MVYKVELIKIVDNRGTMVALNKLPFIVKRFFILKDLKKPRGNHAHKKLWELLIPIVGNFTISVDDGMSSYYEEYLEDKNIGIVIPPNYWRIIKQYSNDCTILSLCSEELDESDYIKNYIEFEEYVKNER